MPSLLIGSKTTGALSWRRWIELKLVSQSLATLYSIPPPFFSPHFGIAAAACAGGSRRRNRMHLFLACRGDRAELNPHRWQCKRGVLGPRECLVCTQIPPLKRLEQASGRSKSRSSERQARQWQANSSSGSCGSSRFFELVLIQGN